MDWLKNGGNSMGDEDKQKIKNVMKNYRRMDSNTIKIFKEYGLVVRKEKNILKFIGQIV